MLELVGLHTALLASCSCNLRRGSFAIVYQARHWVHAARLFEEMKAAGVQPDVVTYNSLINAYARCGRVAEVSRAAFAHAAFIYIHKRKLLKHSAV
jgi:pentatricopeptide repeat protein